MEFPVRRPCLRPHSNHATHSEENAGALSGGIVSGECRLATKVLKITHRFPALKLVIATGYPTDI